MLDAWCLMLEHLPDPSTKGGGLRPRPQRGAAFGRPPLWNPLWMGLAGVQASSTKHQASSIKLLGYEAMRLGVAHTIFFGGPHGVPRKHLYFSVFIIHGFPMDVPLSVPLFFTWILHSKFHGFSMDRFFMIFP